MGPIILGLFLGMIGALCDLCCAKKNKKDDELRHRTNLNSYCASGANYNSFQPPTYVDNRGYVRV